MGGEDGWERRRGFDDGLRRRKQEQEGKGAERGGVFGEVEVEVR